jgi:hypothetical protein
MANEGTRSKDEPRDEGDDIEQLKRLKERLELKTQLAALNAPWWRRAGVITAITAFAASVLPVTTAIQEHYRNEREFALQQTKQQSELDLQTVSQSNDIELQRVRQEHDIRLAYLDRFEVPGKRRQTLRFLIATSSDARLLAWAREELAAVQDELMKIDEELAVVTKKIQQLAPTQPVPDHLKQQRDELNRLRAQSTLRPTESTGSGSVGRDGVRGDGVCGDGVRSAAMIAASRRSVQPLCSIAFGSGRGAS